MGNSEGSQSLSEAEHFRAFQRPWPEKGSILKLESTFKSCIDPSWPGCEISKINSSGASERVKSTGWVLISCACNLFSSASKVPTLTALGRFERVLLSYLCKLSLLAFEGPCDRYVCCHYHPGAQYGQQWGMLDRAQLTGLEFCFCLCNLSLPAA